MGESVHGFTNLGSKAGKGNKESHNNFDDVERDLHDELDDVASSIRDILWIEKKGNVGNREEKQCWEAR